MNCLDFLSGSPKLFIFQKEANKTNFGGVLFLIYILIMILISTFYLINYIINDKYIFEGTSINNVTDYYSYVDMNNDIELNPFLNYTIKIEFMYIDNFAVYDNHNYHYFQNMEEYNFRYRANQINLDIYYLCGEDENCTSFKTMNDQYGILSIQYPYFNINHFDNPPVQFDEEKYVYIVNPLSLPQFGFYQWEFEWEVIKYKDHKSFFDIFTNRKIEYTFGHLKDSRPYKEYLWPYEKVKIDEKHYALKILNIRNFNYHSEYILYKRKKIELLDVIANIGALFATIKYFFSLLFHFYSKNFDNYKIIEKILKNPKEPIKKIELSSKMNMPLLPNKKEDDSKMIINNTNELTINDSDINEENSNETMDISLKKLSFYDFFFNNLYSKCCRRIRNQEIINNANNIIYKYLSADSLLFNQIKLENLFKDYIWNDNLLNGIKNNELLIKFKYY